MKKKIILGLGLVIILCAALVIFAKQADAPAPRISTVTPVASTQTANPQPAGLNKARYSIIESNSQWMIVNKQRKLTAGYVPADLVVPNVSLRLGANEEQMQLRKLAEPDLIAMFQAATKDNVKLVFGSGYRSEKLQKTFYDQYVSQSGQAAADTFSARPGYSEHQTGLAFDATNADGTCHLEVCFADTPGGQWLAKNAHTYGFVVRYLKDKQTVTGYQYEPWHLRYVGRDLAPEVYKAGQTLEEFFGLPAATQY